MSTGWKVSVPSAIAATACTPPKTLVGAAEMHRGDRLGVRTALVRRRASRDVANPGNPRRHDAHMRRGDHRIPSARNITADTVDRDVLVAEHDAGQWLDLDIAHCCALD